MNEHESVLLTRDIPSQHLAAGDVGVVVHRYAGKGGYEVEFLRASGETVAVLTLGATDVRPLSGGEILHVRTIAPV